MGERYYCLTCRVSTEYLPEIELYSCGNCEQVFKREEVLPERFIVPSLEQILQDLIGGKK